MEPIKILVDEHSLIRKGLECLSLAIEKIENEEHVPVLFFHKWLEFYRNYILNYHHFKEEHVMFKELAQKKEGNIDGQIEALRYQHERGRNFINEISDSLKGYEKKDEIDVTTLLESLAAYISLLRHHIHREEHVFYPLVEKIFSDGEKEGLIKQFNSEDEKVGLENILKYKNIVVEMGELITD